MRRIPRRLALWTVSIFCVLLLAACNNSPTLKSISVIPATQTISATTTQQFTATLKYSDGATKPGAGLVAWSSGTTSVATIDPASGVATGAAAGMSTITATYKGVSGTAMLSVNQLLSIAVTPMSAAIPNGSTQQFTAMGTFKNPDGTTGNPQDITGMVTWASSKTAVATIDGSGLATAVGTGVTSISAALYGVTSPSASLTVGAATTTSLLITPSPITISTGTTTLFTAVEKLSNGTTQPIPAGTVVNWTSTSGATIVQTSAANAVALGVTAGTSTITATETVSGFTGNATLNVQAAAARFAYVADGSGRGGSGGISGYSVGVTGGTFMALSGSPFAASGPQQVLIHPSGDFMYYIDSGGAVHVEDIDPAHGSLTDSGQAPMTATVTSSANVGVIDPAGRFLYVISSGDKTIFGFKIAQTADKAKATNGLLAGISGMKAPAGYTDTTLNAPTWIMTDRAGKYAYVVNNGGGTVSQYTIDQTSGLLTLIGTQGVAAGSGALFATTDVNGHIFVANSGEKTVSVFSIASGTGVITKIGSNFPVSTASTVFNVLTDPTGKYLYILDSPVTAGQVFAFNLNSTSTTNVIGTQIGSAVATGASPVGMAIDPTGALLAIDNNGDATISLYTVSTTTGAVTPASPATVAADQVPQFVTFYTAASDQ